MLNGTETVLVDIFPTNIEFMLGIDWIDLFYTGKHMSRGISWQPGLPRLQPCESPNASSAMKSEMGVS